MKAILLCVSLIFSTYLVKAQTSEEFYEMSQRKFDNKQYLDAHALIDKAIDKDKSQYKNYILKAIINLNLSHHPEAMENALLAIKFAPDKSEPYKFAGQLYDSYGFADSSITMLNRALTRAENDSVKYNIIIARSSTYRNIRNFDAAKKDLEFVLKTHPDNPAALNNLAIIYGQQKVYDKAIIYLEKVAKLDSTVVWPFINLGLYYTETGNYEVAKTNYDYALTISPDEALIFSNRGYLFYKMGEYTLAIKDLNKSIQDYPTNSYAYRNRELVYLAMAKKEEACRDLNAALENGFTQRYGDEVKKLAKKNCR